jgi:hypothetical protein
VSPVTLVQRLGESGPYVYDYANDAVISAGDPIASVVSVTPIPQNPANALLPTVGAISLSGTKVQVILTGTQDNATYLMRFVVLTAAGYVRVGLGILNVSEN